MGDEKLELILISKIVHCNVFPSLLAVRTFFIEEVLIRDLPEGINIQTIKNYFGIYKPALNIV